jgi:biotin carboxyl carrier protein
MRFEVQLESVGGKLRRVVELEREGEGYRILVDGKKLDADVAQISASTISILLDGQSYVVHVTPMLEGRVKLQTGPHEYTAEVMDPRAWKGRKHSVVEAEGRQQIIAPMPGKVIRILVAAGDVVEAGQGLAVIEAMKMQNEIKSPKSGLVERVIVMEGQNVNAGEILAWVE